MPLRASGQFLIIAFFSLLLYTVIRAEGPGPEGGVDFSAELPRIPYLDLDEAMKAFEVAPGYTIQRIAAEPLVNSPVAMCFEASGKLYIVEMRDYSEQEHDCLGQVRLLEDVDRDGIYDRATVFAEGLSWPTAIIAFDGGVFVGAAPDIYYLKDTNGDGVADEKRVVFTGFGRGNVQGLMNSFRWGLDNRIHGVTSHCGGLVQQMAHPEAPPVNLRGRDFSFDPRKLDLRPESGGGQHGMSYDDWGRQFTCNNSVHASIILFEDRYVARNPFLIAPPARVNISPDGVQPPVFRSSPVEPWRIVRTRMRNQVGGPNSREGGGQPAGHFTAATGITIVRGDAMGPDFRGVAMIGDVGSNLVHRRKLVPNGIQFQALRIDEDAEFIRSSDIWFRPVQFSNGPDGCLHILDMYREVIEHPKSLPEVIKKHLDLTSGRDRGRVYRVFKTGETLRSTPDIQALSSFELVELLSHDNAWHRETASRLLFERQDQSVIPALRQLVTSGENPLGRLHGLWTLDGMKALDLQSVLAGLSDNQPEIRESALRLAERFTDSDEVAAAIGRLVEDDAPRMRFQLAFTAGEFPLETRLPILEKIAVQNGADPMFAMAIQSSLSQGADKVLLSMLDRNTLHRGLLSRLTTQVARQATPEQLTPVLERMINIPEEHRSLKVELITTLMSENPKFRRQLSSGTGSSVLEPMFAAARNQIADSNPLKKRLEGISILRLSSLPEDLDLLLELLAPHEPSSIQVAALQSLSIQDSPEVANGILARWPEMTPTIRKSAEELLFSRPVWIDVVLSRLEEGTLPRSAIPRDRLVSVMKGANPKLRERAQKLCDTGNMTSRAQVLQDYQAALTLEGSPERGKILFGKHCSTCHRLEGIGYEIGPSLTTIKNRGAETIFLNVLDPNREINPEFLNYAISLTDGRTKTGIIRGESATSLTLLRAENQSDSLLRSEIDEIRNSGVSLMPEELEKHFDPQGFADLIAYLMRLP